MPAPLLTAQQLTDFLHAGFPGAEREARMAVESVDDTSLVLRFRVLDGDLRPGATVSGPTIFAIADATAWLLTVAHLGEGRDAVTSSITLHFLRRPALGDLLGEGRLLKMGRRLAVSEVLVRSDGAEEPVAAATVTYAPV